MHLEGSFKLVLLIIFHFSPFWAHCGGVKWLQDKVDKMELVICQADKGGSILIVPTEYVNKSISDKLNNTNLFEKMKSDPRDDLNNQLFELWRQGKNAEYVTEHEAHKIVGITPNNNKSTSSHFKPGNTYFYPSVKIHKLPDEDI